MSPTTTHESGRSRHIALRCDTGHVLEATPDLIHVTHVSSVAVGYEFHCEQCSSIVSVVADPAHLAMLFEFGVRATAAPTASPLSFVSEQRRLVSLRYLPTSADVVPAVASPAPQKGTGPSASPTSPR